MSAQLGLCRSLRRHGLPRAANAALTSLSCQVHLLGSRVCDDGKGYAHTGVMDSQVASWSAPSAVPVTTAVEVLQEKVGTRDRRENGDTDLLKKCACALPLWWWAGAAV